MDAGLPTDLLARLQQIQDLLADRSGLCLVLVNGQGEEITIPSRLPLTCINESHQPTCLSEIRQLARKARNREDAVIQQCSHGLYVFGLKTSIKTAGGEVYLIGGRTTDLARINQELPLLSAIYRLPLATASSHKVKEKQAGEETLIPGALRLLTPQEIKILYLIGSGFSNKGIASKLYISPNTVKAHVSRILQKLQLSNRTDAALFAVENGLVKRDQIVQN